MMLLEVRDLRAGYDKVEIVHGMTFTADKGEFVCLISANGCGKTTTLKCMLGLLEPFSGQVLVDGVDTTSMSEKQRARHFAYIPQAHTPPFPFSVADVVILGRTPYINTLARVSDEDRCIAYDAMRLLGIEGFADRVYTALSGGQQQLVLIARALAQQPDVLVMDEPTASLDFGNQHMVLRQMKKLTESGTAVVMVTHDPDHALYCADKVVVMHEGSLLAAGDPLQVMDDACLQTIYETRAHIVSAQTVGNPVNVSGAQGSVSYAMESGSSYLAVASNGEITVAARTPAGSYTAVVVVTAAGDSTHAAGSQNVSITVTVNKASNTLAVSAVKATQSATYGKAATYASASAFKVTSNVSGGAVTYAKSSGDSKIAVSSAGKVTVKAGLAAGTYTVKVKATSKATKNYKAKSKTITFKVKVK